MREKLREKQVETLIKIQSAVFEKAQSYTRIVIGLGYAGFFAAWAGTRSYLLAHEVVASALLITVSLFFYISYEIYQMIYYATDLKGFAKLAKAPLDEFEQRAQEHERMHERKNINLMRVWVVALFLTVLPGLTGALMLISGFVQFLLRDHRP